MGKDIDGGELIVGNAQAFELLELAEEVLDQVLPFVHLLVDRPRRSSARMLGDDGLCSALVEICDDGIGVERFVGDQAIEVDAVDQRLNADRSSSSAAAG